jgi:hypothetical protein
MTPALPLAGERLRKLLHSARISVATAAKIAGYPYPSGLQCHVASTQRYFHPKVIERLFRLVGHGSPAITETQILALAITGGGAEQLTAGDKSQSFLSGVLKVRRACKRTWGGENYGS